MGGPPSRMTQRCSQPTSSTSFDTVPSVFTPWWYIFRRKFAINCLTHPHAHITHTETTRYQQYPAEHIKTTMRPLKYTIILLSAATTSLAGPLAYGICQAGCSGLVVACYSAAGFTFGTVAAAAAPAAIVGCNSAYGTCQAACAASLFAPTL